MLNNLLHKSLHYSTLCSADEAFVSRNQVDDIWKHVYDTFKYEYK